MGQATITQRRRELRKAVGAVAADTVVTTEIRVRHISAIIHRGFFGRLKWLLFGR